MRGEGVVVRGWLVGVLCALCFLCLGGEAFGAGGYELVGSISGLESPRAIAVDRATGDLYVANIGSEPLVARFAASGKPAPFSGSGSYIRGNRLTGQSGEEFEFDGSAVAGVLAVDSSVAGPARGDLYVADSGRERIEVFAPSGVFLGDVDTATAVPLSGGEPCGVAVDGAGNVFVGWSSGHVDEFTPVDEDPADDAFVRELENVGEVCGVGAETGGKTYAELRSEGILLAFEPSEFGKVAPTPIPVGVGVEAFDVDPFSGDLFTAEGGSVIERDSTGAVVGEAFGPIEAGGGLAVDSSLGRVYVSEDNAGVVDIFEIPKPEEAVVGGEFSANVAATSAELGAEINPELLDTTYRFEYGTDESYSEGVVPAVAGSIMAGRTSQRVSAFVRGLQPGVTYHYRVLATNALGTAVGEDHTFTTFALSSFALPDHRGWEMVSPVEKNGGQVGGLTGLPLAEGGVLQASPNGQSVAYDTLSAFGEGALGAPLGNQYLATRTPTGWLSKDLVNPMTAGSFNIIGQGAPYVAASTELTSMLQISGNDFALTPPLSPAAPAGYQNYYLRDTSSALLQPLLTSAPALPGEHFYMEFEGSSSDLGHVVLRSDGALTAGAVENGRANLYVWSPSGGLAAVNVLPGASPGETTPANELELGSGEGAGEREDTSHAVSEDGSSIFFNEKENLYVRENAGGVDARTLLVADEATFSSADANGSRAYYLKCGDLWEFDSGNGTSRDLTVVEGHSCGAGVRGVLGASNDGAYVYFVADGSLTPHSPSGDCNRFNIGDSCGLYVDHEGELSFVGMLSQGDVSDWALALVSRTARVSGDGRHVVFDSVSPVLTRSGYDNRDARTGVPDSEVYEYTFGGEVVCVSCNPTGSRPSGSSSIPAGTPYTGLNSVYESRVVSFDGSRVFFDSNDGLVLQDGNHREDVYEWEGGHAYLISSGTADENASFADASESGDNVFFVTDAQLVGQDTDHLPDLYDARVGGGFAGPVMSTPCAGDNCRPGVTPPLVFGAPTSATFSGPGNVESHPGTKKKAKNPKRKKKKAKKRKSSAKKKLKRGLHSAEGKARSTARGVRFTRGRV